MHEDKWKKRQINNAEIYFSTLVSTWGLTLFVTAFLNIYLCYIGVHDQMWKYVNYACVQSEKLEQEKTNRGHQIKSSHVNLSVEEKKNISSLLYRL